MSNLNSSATVTLTVNGKQAQEMLDKLKRKAQDLEAGIERAAKAGDKVQLQRLQRELRQTKKQIDQIEDATKGVASVMDRLDNAAPRELNRTLRQLRKELDGMQRGSDAWRAQTERIKQVKAQLAAVSAELREQEGFWDRFNRKMNDWQTTLAAGAAAVTGLVMAGRQAVSAYADMDGEMANVRKFTGMTAHQVEQLNEEFKKIDTRTSREDLNKLAEEAGRLGKQSQEDVLGFVRAANQINVALDDLGDGATLTLSKLTNIFGDEKRLGTEKALLSVGSVINELSQNCTASAPYLAEFAQRMAGVGAQAKMTIPQVMGLAAVLDSQGQAVEMSATAVSKVVMDMFKEQDKIIKATGMNAEKFKEALGKGTNEGLMMLLQQLHDLGNIDVLAPVFKDMGENGARAAQVISALAGNLDMVKWEQEEANKAFTEATSVTNEYNVQNTTVQAGLDKAKNRLHEIAVELGEKLMPVMSHIISTSTIALKVLSAMVDFVSKYGTELIGLTASIVAYNVVVNASIIKTKLLAAWTATCRIATTAYNATLKVLNATHILLRYNVAKLTGNYRTMSWLQSDLKKSAAQMKSVYGLLIAVVVALTVAVVAYVKSLNTNAKIEKDLNDIKKEGAKRAVEQKQKLETLREAAKNEKLSLDERYKAIAELNKIVPNYNAHIDKTTGKYRENKQALDDYINSLVRLYEIQGAKEKLQQIGKDRADLVIQKKQAEKDYENAKKNYSANTQANMMIGGREGHAMQMGDNMSLGLKKSAVTSLDKKIKQKDAEVAAIKDAYGEDLQKQEIQGTKPGDGDGGGGGGTTGTTTTKSGSSSKAHEDKFKNEKAWKEKEETLNRIYYAIGQKDYDAYQKRIIEIEQQYNEKILARKDLTEQEQLTAKAERYEAMKKMTEEQLKEQVEAEQAAYDEQLATEKQRYIDGKISLDEYHNTTQQMELAHLKKLSELYADGSKEQLEAQRAYQDKVFEDQQRRQQETEAAAKKHQQELDKLKATYFGDNKEERTIKYNADLASLKEVYDLEIKAAGDSAEEKLRIEEVYQKAKKAIAEQYAMEEGETHRNFLQQQADDITQWLDSDGGKAVTGTLEQVTNAMSSIFSQLTSQVQAELEIQTAAINKRYDAEVSRAEGNKYKINKIEKQREAEIAKAKKEANRKQFAMQVIQAVAQTAQNAIAAYGSAASIPIIGYILAPAAAAMAVAAGMMQVAAIKKQQQASEQQGYAEGGFTPKGRKFEEVGVVHAGEWVASQELVNSPAARPLINALDYAQRTNTIGSLKPADVGRNISPESYIQQVQRPVIIDGGAASSTKESDGSSARMEEFTRTMGRLADRLDEPFVTVNTVTGDTGIKKAQDEYTQLMKNKTPKSRR